MKAIDLFRINYQRAEELLNTHKNAFPRGRPSTKGAGDDLLRSVVVFAAAALDAYLSMRVIQVTKEICFRKNRFPEMAVDYFEKKHGDKAIRNLLNIAVSNDPLKYLMKSLEKSIMGTTFQSPEQVTKALSIMEITDPWLKLDKEIIPTRGVKKKGKKPTCKVFLSEFIDRRNDIVHGGDVYISDKYHGKLKPINRVWVDQSIKKLEKMVLGIEKISQIT